MTFDFLLNLICSGKPIDGTFLVITTNDISAIDHALGAPLTTDVVSKTTRPSRLTRALYLGPLSPEGRRAVAARILVDVPHEIEPAVQAGCGETGDQFQDRCRTIALDYWERGTESTGPR